MLSVAPSQAYQGFNKAKKVAKKQRDMSKLPKNIMEQIDSVKFGCGTLPSDNMNMVMTHDFANDFIRKM